MHRFLHRKGNLVTLSENITSSSTFEKPNHQHDERWQKIVMSRVLVSSGCFYFVTCRICHAKLPSVNWLINWSLPTLHICKCFHCKYVVNIYIYIMNGQNRASGMLSHTGLIRCRYGMITSLRWWKSTEFIHTAFLFQVRGTPILIKSIHAYCIFFKYKRNTNFN